MKKLFWMPAAAMAFFLMPEIAQAHFTLVEPASWLVEVNQLGDPQKLAPCGGTSQNAGTPTGALTEVVGGALLHLKLRETVFHPGHYRVALSVNSRSELPADPEVMTRNTPKGPMSVSAKITNPVVRPVLVDGLFVHTEKAAPDTFFETDVRLPNINCDKCSLQIVEFMAEHSHNPDGDYSYHHCADIRIRANPSMPIAKAWPGQS
jgi:hypothetical protein